MNVLSLFDGISAGRLALERTGVKVNNYYRSEIDKYANQVAMHHYPNDIQMGDVTKWREWDINWASIDLLIGGSPCQGFSFAGKQAGTKAILNDVEILVTDRETYLDLKSKGAEFLSQSHLFWEYVLCLDHIKAHNPNIKFLLENVKMKKELLKMIDEALGVESIVINSALLSAQNRVRHYWCNWSVTQPEDKGVLLRGILEDVVSPEFNLSDKAITYMSKEGKGWTQDGKSRFEHNYNPLNGKAKTLTSNMHKGVPYDVVGIKKVGNVNPSGRGMNGNVYHTYAKSPTLTTNKGEGVKITSGAIRGRYIADGKQQDHKMKVAGLTEQRLEIRGDEKTNCLTTVQKDNVVVFQEKSQTKESKCTSLDTEVTTNYDQIKYRKLTPTECARLQTFPDGWAESVVSNTQAYKAYGNSWTVDVIAHIFSGFFTRNAI